MKQTKHCNDFSIKQQRGWQGEEGGRFGNNQDTLSCCDNNSATRHTVNKESRTDDNRLLIMLTTRTTASQDTMFTTMTTDMTIFLKMNIVIATKISRKKVTHGLETTTDQQRGRKLRLQSVPTKVQTNTYLLYVPKISNAIGRGQSPLLNRLKSRST